MLCFLYALWFLSFCLHFSHCVSIYVSFASCLCTLNFSSGFTIAFNILVFQVQLSTKLTLQGETSIFSFEFVASFFCYVILFFFVVLGLFCCFVLYFFKIVVISNMNDNLRMKNLSYCVHVDFTCGTHQQYGF